MSTFASWSLRNAYPTREGLRLYIAAQCLPQLQACAEYNSESGTLEELLQILGTLLDGRSGGRQNCSKVQESVWQII
jgi:hypothetical protein